MERKANGGDERYWERSSTFTRREEGQEQVTAAEEA